MSALGKICTAVALAGLALGAVTGKAHADSIAYIGNAASDTISVFHFDASTGQMQPLQTVPFTDVAKPGESTPIAISPNRHFLFVAVRSQPYQVLTYAIDPATGKLSFLSSGKLAGSMANIDLDRTGQELFSASYGGNLVAVNPVSADGHVGDPVQVIPTGIKAHAIHADADDRFVFATNLGSDQVLAFTFDPATGRLAPAAHPVMKMQAQSGPRHFLFSNDQRFVYLVDEVDGAVKVFRYDGDQGSWHLLQKTSALPDGFTGKPWAADIHLTADGHFLYTSDRRSSTLKGFRVNTETGLLTPLGSVPTETQPRGFGIDPTGHYLAAVGQLSTDMSVYAIDTKTGALVLKARYPVGKNPNWVTFLPLP